MGLIPSLIVLNSWSRGTLKRKYMKVLSPNVRRANHDSSNILAEQRTYDWSQTAIDAANEWSTVWIIIATLSKYLDN